MESHTSGCCKNGKCTLEWSSKQTGKICAAMYTIHLDCLLCFHLEAVVGKLKTTYSGTYISHNDVNKFGACKVCEQVNTMGAAVAS